MFLKVLRGGVDDERYLEIFYHYGWDVLVMERCIRYPREKREDSCFKFDGIEKITDVEELMKRYPDLERFRGEISREILYHMMREM